MASRIYLLRKDKRKRRLYLKYEINRLFYRSIYLNTNLSKEIRKYAYVKLTKLPKNCLNSRIKNRCVFDNGSKSIFRDFKMSRFKIKDLGSKGLINGLYNSSW